MSAADFTVAGLKRMHMSGGDNICRWTETGRLDNTSASEGILPTNLIRRECLLKISNLVVHLWATQAVYW